ncbi:MAG: biosynthetic arginine decarboxylase [Acidithiobacillus sp.]|uniref:biosynthetic arginine decarboxylase n=1 Tax=Acidithiobacillus sp. TaxID=1872118 RepID=UPI003CFDE17F
MPSWTVADSRKLYNLPHWSAGYFDIDESGFLRVFPHGSPGSEGVRLSEVVAALGEQGLTLPCLLRFPQILAQRVHSLRAAFGAAMENWDYPAAYTPVYPIKVNQHRRVVESILQAGDGSVGLEAGSKPELLTVLALSPEKATIVCNGYKDAEYIRLALMGERLGRRVFLVVEKSSELPLILQIARELRVQPRIGVRARLASAGAGKWQNTGGEKSKFGLSSHEILQLLEELRRAGALQNLQLLHFHLGSQIPNIQHIQGGMRECARLYQELRGQGADIRVVDVGGGLGVDYEGTHSRAYCSANYRVADYAQTVVGILAELCQREQLPYPEIVSESGRALTAHHAVLISNIIDVEPAPGEHPPADSTTSLSVPAWQRLLDRLRGASATEAMEIYQEAVFLLAENQEAFRLGLLKLPERAQAENSYAHLMWRVRTLLDPAKRAHREILDELEEKLVDKYFVNFSLFQSLPDVWAIDQVFPILPIHRLDSEPTRRGRLEDITCDSDGRIDSYVFADGVGPTLPLHPWTRGEAYHLGFFLVGAYQEILGDMHNLFGDTDAVNVVCTDDGGFQLQEPVPGDTVEEVLAYVQFSAQSLAQGFGEQLAARADLSPDEARDFLRQYEEGLKGYTYLE